MGVPSRNPASDRNNQTTSKKGAFPHDYIRENGYAISPLEEQIICTVYQKTPLEQQERLRNGLVKYIEWRCSPSGRNYRHIDDSSTLLHLCSHMNKDIQNPDKEALSEFSKVLERDGITRLDLLWNMKSYRKWFDATPGAFANEVSA